MNIKLEITDIIKEKLLFTLSAINISAINIATQLFTFPITTGGSGRRFVLLSFFFFYSNHIFTMIMRTYMFITKQCLHSSVRRFCSLHLPWTSFLGWLMSLILFPFSFWRDCIESTVSFSPLSRVVIRQISLVLSEQDFMMILLTLSPIIWCKMFSFLRSIL